MNNIPKKKNNRKPVSRKRQSAEKENLDDKALQDAIIQALIGDVKEEENKPKEEKTKLHAHSGDRSKMWQQNPNATILSPNKLSPTKKRSRRTVEDNWSNSTQRTTQDVENKPLWIASVFLGLLLIFGGWFAFELFLGDNEQTTEQLTNEQIDNENISKVTLTAKIEGITDVLNSYFAATSIEEKCKSIYKAEEFKSEIEAYYEKNELKPKEDFEISKIQPVLFNYNEYWEVSVVDKNKKVSLYYLRINDEKVAKIDWKSDVAFQKNDIQSFIKSRSRKPHLFRVYFDSSTVRPVYAWGFTEKEYMYVNLHIPNTENYLWGYIKRDSEISDKLEQLKRETSDFRVVSEKSLGRFIVEIKFMEDSDAENDKAVVIDRIISNSWVNTEE